MCDKSILLRWLYGQPSRPDDGVLHAQTLSCCPHLELAMARSATRRNVGSQTICCLKQQQHNEWESDLRATITIDHAHQNIVWWATMDGPTIVTGF